MGHDGLAQVEPRRDERVRQGDRIRRGSAAGAIDEERGLLRVDALVRMPLDDEAPADHGRGFALRDDLGSPASGSNLIDRHDRGADPQRAQHCDRQFDRRREIEGDPRAAADAAAGEFVREAPGRFIEFGVRHRPGRSITATASGEVAACSGTAPCNSGPSVSVAMPFAVMVPQRYRRPSQNRKEVAAPRRRTSGYFAAYFRLIGLCLQVEAVSPSRTG